ncbi:MAG: polysaccharide biosynthesis tyrosine autokinase, partial [Gammaproteobacteria bacterium]|nr:polysaccharide biosynthesis tyrosine autokinase [Gammaproteobacteria bacterium]
QTNPDVSTSEQFDDEIDLRQYLAIINRYKWPILALSLTLTFIAALITLAIPPTYRATSTLLIEQQQTPTFTLEELYGLERANSEFFLTQVEIIKSREIAKRVVNTLNLNSHPEFNAGRKTVSEKINQQDANQILVNQFLSRLNVTMVKKTNLVDISFESNDAKLSAVASNAIANAYLERNFEQRLNLTQESLTWLNEKLGPLKKSLGDAEKRLQEFRESAKLIDVEGVRSLVSKELNEITIDLQEARKERGEAENLLKQINNGSTWNNIPAILNHKLVQDANAAILSASNKVAELAERYGPEHPTMLAAQSELKTSEQNLERQIKNVLSSIQKSYEISLKNEIALENSLSSAKSEAQSINRKEYQLKELEREVETNRKLYDTFFSRFQEAHATQDFQPFNARITDVAEVPNTPIKPKKKLIVTLSFICSLMLGIFAAFLLEFFNNGIRTAEELERLLNIPALGIIPAVAQPTTHHVYAPELFEMDENYNIGEFVRTIRTAIKLNHIDQAKQVILVTSTAPEEGKSTIASMLALALSKQNKVILVDADMRRPSIGTQFKLKRNHPGLSNLVSGSEPLNTCLQFHPGTDLHILGAGQIPNNPLELIDSTQFAQIIDELRKIYDHVIIDSPPIQAVSDSLVLSKYTDQVVFVVRSETTAAQAVQQGLQKLINCDANVCGAVLNRLDLKKASDYYGYTYYRYHQGKLEKG